MSQDGKKGGAGGVTPGGRKCAICGASIAHRKPGAQTCGDAHRKALERRGGAVVRRAPPPKTKRPTRTTPALVEPEPLDDLEEIEEDVEAERPPPDIAITKAKQAVEELEIKKIERAQKQAELDKLLGKLVPADAVEARFARYSTELRTKALAAPSRAVEYLPDDFAREQKSAAFAAFTRASREMLDAEAKKIEAGEV